VFPHDDIQRPRRSPTMASPDHIPQPRRLTKPTIIRIRLHLWGPGASPVAVTRR
jgi:hypothetical protein